MSKELDLMKRVAIRNTTNIDTYFKYVLKNADAKVAKKSKLSISVEEILAQCDAGNPSFVGRNRDGSHATFYIEDPDVRTHLGFESEDGKIKQDIIDEQAILNLFDLASLSTFVTQLKSKVVTMGEKQTLRDIIGSGKVNAHDRIEVAKRYLRGEKIDEKRKPGRPRKSE